MFSKVAALLMLLVVILPGYATALAFPVKITCQLPPPFLFILAQFTRDLPSQESLPSLQSYRPRRRRASYQTSDGNNWGLVTMKTNMIYPWRWTQTLIRLYPKLWLVRSF